MASAAASGSSTDVDVNGGTSGTKKNPIVIDGAPENASVVSAVNKATIPAAQADHITSKTMANNTTMNDHTGTGDIGMDDDIDMINDTGNGHATSMNPTGTNTNTVTNAHTGVPVAGHTGQALAGNAVQPFAAGNAAQPFAAGNVAFPVVAGLLVIAANPVVAGIPALPVPGNNILPAAGNIPAPVAANNPGPLAGLVIHFSGADPKRKENGVPLHYHDYVTFIENLGGSADKTLAPTHIIPSDAAVKVPSRQVSHAFADPNCKVLRFQWLMECRRLGRYVPKGPYLIRSRRN